MPQVKNPSNLQQCLYAAKTSEKCMNKVGYKAKNRGGAWGGEFNYLCDKHKGCLDNAEPITLEDYVSKSLERGL